MKDDYSDYTMTTTGWTFSVEQGSNISVFHLQWGESSLQWIATKSTFHFSQQSRH